MKKILTFLSLAIIVSNVNATKVMITCQNTPSHFLPVMANATVGDTIHWTWVAGTHIVGPISASDIPAGAAMFNGPIDSGHQSFEYVVTVPGSYHYVCHPATPHGEDAYITVVAATGVQEYNVNNLSSAYPNPFAEKITIETSNIDMIIVYNSIGEKVSSFPVKSSGPVKFEADLATLPKGIFFYSIIKNGAVLETRRIIKD